MARTLKRINALIIIMVMSFGLLPKVMLPVLAQGYDPESSSLVLINNSAERYGANGNFLAPIDVPVQESIPISNRAELEAIKDNLNGKYHLTADIDLSGEEWVPIGDNFFNSNTNRFTGTFDGQGYVIRNLKMTGDREYSGLFGYIDGAVIKNVGLEDTDIVIDYYPKSSIYTGGICGRSDNSSINNCYNTGNISSSAADPYSADSVGSYAGGICGYSNGSINNCYNTGTVSASFTSHFFKSFFTNYSSYASGICAYSGGDISGCYNTGNISASAIIDRYDTCYTYTGGICAYNRGNINNCYSTGDNISTALYSSYAGGICGYSYFGDSIINCYNTGAVSAFTSSTSSNATTSSSDAGGICGSIVGSRSIINCYNKGTVSTSSYYNSRSGGICGSGSYDISNCYNTGDVSASASYYYSSRAGGIYASGSGKINNCYNTGNISASAATTADSYAGGICGASNDSIISNCYNIGNIFAIASNSTSVDSYVGGILGKDDGRNNINNCYNTGDTSASASDDTAFKSYVGGICGYSYGSNVNNCYWNIDSAQIINNNPQDPAKGFGSMLSSGTDTTVSLTSTQMKQQASFDGFEFGTVWGFESGKNNGYPILSGFSFLITAMAGTGGTISEGGRYSLCETVILTAEADNGYSFDGWYEKDTKVSANPVYSFIAEADRTLDARFTETLISLEITSSSLIIDKDAGIISGITPETTIDELKALLDNDADTIKIYRNNEEVITGEIGTGMEIRLVVSGEVLQTLNIIIIGDVNGDGDINIFDIMEIRDHIFGKKTLLGNAAIAANVNSDGDINIFDIMMIRDYIFGKLTEL